MIFNLSQDKIKKTYSVILIVSSVKQQHTLWTKKKDIMEEINEYEIDGLIQTLKEMGIKGLIKRELNSN